MRNFWGNISLALKLKFGIVPSTQVYESKLKNIWDDVEFIREFSKGDLWKEYEEFGKAKHLSKEERKSARIRIKEIVQSESWKRYTKLKKSSTIAEFLRLEETFSDDFECEKIDEAKWLTKFFWGETILGKGYSHSEEFHNYTEGKNLRFKNSTLIISTNEEENTSLSWNKKYGFLSRKSGFTSGIINTGKSFRQQHGRFEAKMDFNHTDGIYNAFYMIGNSASPHLNIFKVSQNFELGLINGTKDKDNNQSKVSLNLLKENSYIAGIEWNDKEIKWLLNGVVVKRITNNLPNTPLYLVFSSGVYKNVKGTESNDFLIDWVRCYKKN
ncbi:glycoside hydrolase family 16 protein [uncultured Acetobacteroides sp.]|uniref:glycoside hydrolase family 16 protein n=1 Tax=uncultured Acetobacteroides sp. TaxID=1760811 RepID=UPI0029F46863|nr:glycoside hydrolase family 16 protein [uncultured Acetobacteroides sp.]